MRCKLYDMWVNIKGRCHNPQNPSFKNYGGRGITLWLPWSTQPSDFIDWVEKHLGDCPPGFTIDRIDNDGNYEPGNLRWATRLQQNLNRRSKKRALPVGVRKHGNKFRSEITIHGKKKHLGLFLTPEDAHEAFLIAKRSR